MNNAEMKPIPCWQHKSVIADLLLVIATIDNCHGCLARSRDHATHLHTLERAGNLLEVPPHRRWWLR